MRTESWIDLLARQAEPVAARHVRPLMARWLPLGLVGAVLIMLAGYGVLRDLPAVAHLPMFWFKLAMPLAVALAGAVLLARLARPGVGGAYAWWGVALPVLLVWLLGAWQWLGALPAERPALVWGQTWRSCVFSIALIALPVLASALAVLEQMAPTRPALAGAAAGLLAGGVGAAVYALHCPEMTAPFLAVWYVLGIAMTAALGALVGARTLRW